MNCDKCQELLLDYARGLLPDESNTEIQEHLTSCEKCAEELKQIQPIVLLAQKAQEFKATQESPELARNIASHLNQLRDETPPTPRITPWQSVLNTIKEIFSGQFLGIPVTTLATTTATLVILLAGYIILTNNQTQIDPSSLANQLALGHLNDIINNSTAISTLNNPNRYNPFTLTPITMGPNTPPKTLTNQFTSTVALLSLTSATQTSILATRLILSTSPGLVLTQTPPETTPLIATLTTTKDNNGNYQINIKREYLILATPILHDTTTNLTIYLAPGLKDPLITGTTPATLASLAINQATTGHIISLTENQNPIQTDTLQIQALENGHITLEHPEDTDLLTNLSPASTIYNNKAETIAIITQNPHGPKLISTTEIENLIPHALAKAAKATSLNQPPTLPPELKTGDQIPYQIPTIKGGKAIINILNDGQYSIEIALDQVSPTILRLTSIHPGILITNNTTAISP